MAWATTESSDEQRSRGVATGSRYGDGQPRQAIGDGQPRPRLAAIGEPREGRGRREGRECPVIVRHNCDGAVKDSRGIRHRHL
jgi:hypothetical protein